MIKTCFHISFTSDSRCQKVKLNGILEYLRNEIPELTSENLFDLRIIYNELISNAFIHGNRHDCTKNVELFIEADDSVITSIVRDDGTGFNYSSLFKSTIVPDNIFCEYGRGLQLVIGLADLVEWNEAGNEIMVHKNIRVG